MLRIDSSEIAIIANKLDRMHRSTFPVVVRNTLNNMAFRMQRNEIQKSASEQFDYKRTGIVQNLSWATKAQGFNVKTMKSVAGIRPRPGREDVASGLAAQEVGGKLNSRVVPTLKARGGKASSKVRSINKLSGKEAIDARHLKKNRFIAAAAAAKKNNLMLLVKTGNKAVYARVSRFNRKNRSLPVKLTWLYLLENEKKSIKSGDKKPFIKKAYIRTMDEFGSEFLKQANKKLR